MRENWSAAWKTTLRCCFWKADRKMLRNWPRRSAGSDQAGAGPLTAREQVWQDFVQRLRVAVEATASTRLAAWSELGDKEAVRAALAPVRQLAAAE